MQLCTSSNSSGGGPPHLSKQSPPIIPASMHSSQHMHSSTLPQAVMSSPHCSSMHISHSMLPPPVEPVAMPVSVPVIGGVIVSSIAAVESPGGGPPVDVSPLPSPIVVMPALMPAVVIAPPVPVPVPVAPSVPLPWVVPSSLHASVSAAATSKNLPDLLDLQA